MEFVSSEVRLAPLDNISILQPTAANNASSHAASVPSLHPTVLLAQTASPSTKIFVCLHQTPVVVDHSKAATDSAKNALRNARLVYQPALAALVPLDSASTASIVSEL